jgi:hypothetical protein
VAEPVLATPVVAASSGTRFANLQLLASLQSFANRQSTNLQSTNLQSFTNRQSTRQSPIDNPSIGNLQSSIFNG